MKDELRRAIRQDKYAYCRHCTKIPARKRGRAILQQELRRDVLRWEHVAGE